MSKAQALCITMAEEFVMERKITGTDVNQIPITSLHHIKGQRHVVENLQVNLRAYFNAKSSSNEEVTFGPAIFCGPSGTGKTMMAKALDAELANLKLIESNGVALNNQADLFSILLDANENTTVFIDEAHCMNSKAQHILMTALSEKKIYVPSGISAAAAHVLPLANFVMILATTHEYCLQEALRNRMRIYFRLNYYSLADLIEIVRQRVNTLNWRYESDEVLRIIAQRAKKTPRQALHINLQMCWTVAKSHDRDVITLQDVHDAFHHLRIDQLGLNNLDRSYLKILHESGALALNVLSSKLAVPALTLQKVVEPYLLKEGFILKDRASLRLLTAKGRNHLENRLTAHQSCVAE